MTAPIRSVLLRGMLVPVKSVPRHIGRCLFRQQSTKAKPPTPGLEFPLPLVVGATVCVVGVGCYGITNSIKKTVSDSHEENSKIMKQPQLIMSDEENTPKAIPEEPSVWQPSVVSPGKNYALYLWIHLKPNLCDANAREVAKVCSQLQNFVEEVVAPDFRDDEDYEVLAGVGFGSDFYSQIGGKPPKEYHYLHRQGKFGQLPSSGGDVFVHAKSNTPSNLFELCGLFLRALPQDSIADYEDIYSFVYKFGRDLSGFIDGTENRADEEGRQEVAVDKKTGGSFAITQKWIHDLDVINTEKTETLESWVGRDRADSTELPKKSITSHVARMTSGNQRGAWKPVEIVRQSMPFGTARGEHGLFFIGYAACPYNFDYMLSRMVGDAVDGHNDDIMRLSRNTKGNYWFFPGTHDLAKLGTCGE